VKGTRVARWYISRPKIAIWVNSGGSGIGRCWYVLWTFGQCMYFTAIWYTLWTFGKFCGHSVYYVVIWYIFPHFVVLYQEKSGNPAMNARPIGEPLLF
jgi:hypothetical protein